MRTKSHGRWGLGFTTLEILVALMLLALVVVYSGRANVAAMALIGRGDTDIQKGARARSEATAWIQAATEYTQKVGFDALTPSCITYTCSFWIPPTLADATAPYHLGPSLPQGFQCGRVMLSDWDGAGPLNAANQLRLVTTEVYRVKASCSSAGSESPFQIAHTGIAFR